jgi:hypothetical protein
MEPGVPIVRKPGYCFVSTEYVQNGRARNPSDTLDQLAQYSEVRGHVSAGNGFALTSKLTGIAGTTALTFGILGATGGMNMERGVTTALIASGAAAGVISVVTCVMAEGQYATAVDIYNGRIATHGAAQDLESDSTAGSDRDPYDDEGRTKKPVTDTNAPP